MEAASLVVALAAVVTVTSALDSVASNAAASADAVIAIADLVRFASLIH